MQLVFLKIWSSAAGRCANTNQQLTPSTERAVSEAKVIITQGRPELHKVWGGQIFGEFPTHHCFGGIPHVVFAIFGVVGL
ncbi:MULTISPECIES: hypothetical protein [Cyanophyceae]|uniref:hypothetical protein n=1 Tax=Cyanophyceae TaxID=3028117 RepID=UPI0016883D95|nr:MULTISPECIES: hypothetical protein [Cyanophyceae]MBD1916905.1 hypothetical protein [Phormidium sp. FACHB-77]MBD2029911.1 hypothetical protein [Phormidium sp. FACHB-322]MBD2053107.1 hypothetical protein [Leptolyngbya sp. FACHB-60]